MLLLNLLILQLEKEEITTTIDLPKEGKRKLNREEKAEKGKKRRKKEKIQLIMIDSRGRRWRRQKRRRKKKTLLPDFEDIYICM